ncbi:alpha/beta fold hydrolase [Kribbella capetownensis]|uniref:Alpha/beta fold hydrolase n=1 Tax=Kribbella capetownensis TaxID=1572659 RepID=A0A4R0JA49_9ACTN|nr:alpha/beta fold hydrolase [Kribbella capetownensis]TCC42807.1 alpha/beta fold hydrolase [Kribbella capetownensis]
MLLHGIGSSHRAWSPVVAVLAEHFDVIAVDLPGFGESPPLPVGVEPHPAALAGAVANLLDGLGIVAPAVAGNSLGAWIALELAAVRPISCLVLISPAGLWPGRTPLYNRLSLQASRWLTRRWCRPLSRLVNHRFGRALLLRQAVGRPSRISPDRAREMVWDMASGAGFDATLEATLDRHYLARPGFDVPITVAFGSRDLLLGRRSRHVEQLPPGARLEQLAGCGHVPMSDSPQAVAALITAAAHQAFSAAP